MELRDYQKEDVLKLTSRPAMGCFNEQRTGKTPTALKAMEKQGVTKLLIICPASAIYQWKEAYEIWLNKPCVIAAGTPAKRKKAIESWTNGLIISYDTLKTTKAKQGEIDLILAQNPEGVILDECHRIKNPKSAAARSVFKTVKIPYRLALSGTPAPNKAYEIFSILHWLCPTIYTSYWNFINEYFMTVRRQAQGHTFIDILTFKPGMREKLQIRLNSISTQRKRSDVMDWLPEKDYEYVKLEPTKEQQKYLKDLEKYFETGDIVVQGILDRLVRYRQICLHPGLLGLKGESPKLNYVTQYIKDYPEKSIIVFSKFTSFIKLLEKELQPDSFYTIIGSTPIKDRAEFVKSFQNKERNILLLNIDAGKEALTLDTAETIIFTDKYPPVSDILQAEDRFVSTTVDKANKPHLIINLILKGTFDEHLYKLINKRKSETDVINDYKKYLKATVKGGETDGN